MIAAYRTAFVTLAISSVVTALVALGSRTTGFRDLNFWTYDFLVTHKQDAAPSSKILIVDFDDATLARIRQFPIPRDVVAAVVERIAKAGAKIIGLDFLLTEERTAAQDRAMQQALAGAGNVILASQSGSGGIPAIQPSANFCAPDPASFGDCRAGAFGFAFVNMPIDSDGFIRRMMLFSLDEHQSESFPLKIAQLYTGTALTAGAKSATFAAHPVPYADDAKTVLIGSWANNPAPSIPVIDVLDGKLRMTEFRDKIVLIGQSNDAARDREFTPIFRRSTPSGVRLRLPGTEIHAAAIATLLDGTSIRPVSIQAVLVFSFLLTCLTVWMLSQFALRHSLVGAAVLIVCSYIAAQLLFNFDHRWFQYLIAQACIAAAVPFSLTYQYLREQFQKREAVAQRAQIMGLFSRYVAPEVANEIWRRREEVVLAGEERIATVLFSDIRSFTALTAGKPSKTVLAWLNSYLTSMDEVITAEGGFLNKFIGDGLMVLFGVPLSQGAEQDAAHALRAAIRMIEKVQELNLRQANSDFPLLKIGIGLHTGLLTCGSVGSRKRLEYSVIGETVNLASRLESLTKDFKTEIVLSEATYHHVAAHFSGFRDLGLIPVRGFQQTIRLYTIELPVPQQTTAAEGVEHEDLSAANTDPVSQRASGGAEHVEPTKSALPIN